MIIVDDEGMQLATLAKIFDVPVELIAAWHRREPMLYKVSRKHLDKRHKGRNQLSRHERRLLAKGIYGIWR